MKPNPDLLKIAVLTLAACFANGPATQAQDPAKPAAPRIDIVDLRAVPAGNYLVNLQLDGQEQRVNIEVKGDAARCVHSSAPRLQGMQGKFELIGNGVFTVFFQSDAGHRATQLWLFRPDGTARVKEVPDRDEKQLATPVRDDSIDPPVKS